MSAPRLPMRKIREVLRLKHERGLTHREVAHACSISIGAVTLYVRRAAAHGWGWPLPDELDNATLEARLFPRAAAIRDRPPPAFAEIHRELARTGVTLQLLWEEYAQVYPEGYRYSQFCVLYRQWARRLRPSMRQVHRAGEKTFIDFSGKRPTVVDRRTGEVRSVEPCSAPAATPTPKRRRRSNSRTGWARIREWSSTSGARPPCGYRTS